MKWLQRVRVSAHDTEGHNAAKYRKNAVEIIDTKVQTALGAI